jgi:peroxiredoxin
MYGAGLLAAGWLSRDTGGGRGGHRCQRGYGSQSREFAGKHNLPFAILPDPERTIIGKYGVGMPLIGISRRVTFIIGKDGVIRHVITDARTKDHDRQVLDALRMLAQEG